MEKFSFYFRRNGASTTLWGLRESSLPFGLGRSTPSLLYAGPLELYAPVSSRNGKELYVVGADARGELSFYDANSRKLVPFLNGISACMVTFSPDHQWVAYVSYPDGALWKSRIDGSEKMQLTFPPMGVVSPRWSPDGRFIVFLDVYGSEFHSIYLISSQGGQPRVLVSGPFSLHDPTWSADSRYIAYGGDVELHQQNKNTGLEYNDVRKSARIRGSIQSSMVARWEVYCCNHHRCSSGTDDLQCRSTKVSLRWERPAVGTHGLTTASTCTCTL